MIVWRSTFRHTIQTGSILQCVRLQIKTPLTKARVVCQVPAYVHG